MCILFFSCNESPLLSKYKLILASNRDEHLARPTTVASEWGEKALCFGGRDMEPGREGGTWLALGRTDNAVKVAALLNVTGEARKTEAKGRGFLINDYIKGVATNKEYCQGLLKESNQYSAFNLVTIELRDNQSSIVYCSNAPEEVIELPENEIYGMGNSPQNAPFEKVKRGRMQFEDIIKKHMDEDKDVLKNNLMNLLKDTERHWPDDELNKRSPIFGKELSSICARVSTAEYGSRTHTIILVDHQNQMDMYEETLMGPTFDSGWQSTHIHRQL